MTLWISAYFGIGFLLAVIFVRKWGHDDWEDAFAGAAITAAWLPMAVIMGPILIVGGLVRLLAGRPRNPEGPHGA